MRKFIPLKKLLLKKSLRIPLIIAAGLVLIIGILSFIFFVRSHVLVVTDLSFAAVYGENRLRRQIQRSSLSLFRRVLPVIVAEGASEDIVVFAINEASSRPFCVIFPLRFVSAARLFGLQRPGVPAIILEGRNIADIDDLVPRGTFFRFRTDTEADFYAAGRFASILKGEQDGKTAVFLNEHFQNNERQVFRQAFVSNGRTADVQFFSSLEEVTDFSGISCAVIAGAGADIFGRRVDFPVILFSWLSPEMTPTSVVVIFNDSPWVQTVPAVRMAASGIKNGEIASKILILSSRIADNGVLRRLRSR